MSQFNADDSDCIIEERNITCITIDDSQEIACPSESGEDEELPPPPPALDQEMEEGEVSDDEKDNMEKETICELKFPKKSLYEEYGKHIIDTIKEGLSAKMPEKCIEITQQELEECITLMVQKVVAKDVEDIPMPPSLKADTKRDNQNNRGEAFEKELSPDLSGISELFTIDTAPAPKIDSVKVPSYKRAIKDALLDGEAAARKKQKEEEEVFKTKKTNSCFNCGDTGHSIRDCTKPHNAKRIKNAKRACFKVERYHVDIEQRFAHLKPGCISDKLREALGLRRGELPFFFYRMRVLGYPPGWLEEAKVEHSGINLFNSDGTKILHSDEDEGEVDAVNHKYNISKIYDFPGFNQDPGENFFDDYKYHNVPPLSKHQMKDEFVKTMGDHVLKGYKRKKLKDFPNASAEDNITETSVQEACDMEIEDPEKTTLGEVQFSRPPPPADNPPSVSPPPPPPSPPPPPESPTIEIDCKENDISLRELEKQKQQLLKELNSNSSVIEIEDSLIDDIIELDEEDDKRTQDKTNVQTKSDNSSESTPIDENRKPTSQTTVIKESYEGTPVLKFSPYDNLPNGEKFKVGVSDVINFENLPDSTGKYEQMKQVLKKVRTCVSKLHSEE